MQTTGVLKLIFGVLTLSLLASPAQVQGHAGTWPRLGKSVGSAEAQALEQSFEALRTKSIETDATTLAFNRFFGGQNGTAVENYLKSRIDFIVSKDSSLTVTTASAKVRMLPVFTNPKFSSTQNPSFLLWVAGAWNRKQLSSYDGIEFSADLKPKNVPNKVIQLGSDFGKYFPLYGVSVLVHEAKHSECEGGIDSKSLEDWKKLKSSKELALAFAKHPCGHSHKLCPDDSSFGGKMGCDSTLEGPYAVQYVFNRAVVKHCKNCSFSERALLQIFALDAATRLPLPRSISRTVTQTLDRLPQLQASLSPQELIDRVLESVLTPVDQALDSEMLKIGQWSKPKQFGMVNPYSLEKTQ